MSILKDIEDVNTTAELRTLYRDTYLPMKTARATLLKDRATVAVLRKSVADNESLLRDFGKLVDVKKAFYAKLGVLNKTLLSS